jgi:serine/threonine-protein kinase
MVTVAELSVPDARDGETLVASAAGESQATRVEPPAQSHVAARDLLRHEEASRARGFAGTTAVLAVFALCAFPLFAGRTPYEPIYVVSLVTMSSASIWVWRRTRDPRGYTTGVFRVFAVVSLISSMGMIMYGGPFSPVPVILTLGIAFFGLGDDRRWALGMGFVAIGGYALIAALVATGVLVDHGIIKATSTDPTLLLFFSAVITPGALLLTLWQARLSRRATHDAMARFQEAERITRQREAQLAEAFHDLRAARQGGAGDEGRCTGWRAGEYELGVVIGRGAMGEVYAARHRESGEMAAVKVLARAILEHEAYLRRFEREGAIAAALNAPNVVRVHAVGHFDDRSPYIVMELLRGTDLGSLILRDRLDNRELLEMTRQIAAGLDAVHAVGVVHRDVKPRNLFRADTPEGTVWKLLDFGVSRIGDSTGTLTEGAVVGTPGYMSPEQARGKTALDHRADVFSMGAVLYRCVTGQPPFAGQDLPQMLFDIVFHQPLQPSQLASQLPRDVDLLLALALAKEPDDRFASATELAEAAASAFRGRLSAPLRARATALLGAAPWRRAA